MQGALAGAPMSLTFCPQEAVSSLVMSIIDPKPHEDPRAGELVFRDDLPDWYNNACLRITSDCDDLFYAKGYQRGAELLFEAANDPDSTERDFLVYPIVYLYRHSIELLLKRLIWNSQYLLDRELKPDEIGNLGRHRLEHLWRDAKPLLEEIVHRGMCREFDSRAMAGVEDQIRQLDKVDPDSYAFRYSKKKIIHSTPPSSSLPEDMTRFNVRHFAEMMGRLVAYLDGIDAGLCEMLDLKAEVEAQYRGEREYF